MKVTHLVFKILFLFISLLCLIKLKIDLGIVSFLKLSSGIKGIFVQLKGKEIIASTLFFYARGISCLHY